MKKIAGFFQDSQGNWSSTRVGGLGCIGAGILGFLLDMVPALEINHVALDIIILAGVALLTVKDLKKKNVQ